MIATMIIPLTLTIVVVPYAAQVIARGSTA